MYSISGLVPGAQRIVQAGGLVVWGNTWLGQERGRAPLLLAGDWRAFFDKYIITPATGSALAEATTSPGGVPISYTRPIIIGGTSATGGILIPGVARGSSASSAHYPHDAITTPNEHASSDHSAEKAGI
ncbi:hypothetical protein FIBSPDRAFT_968965 [Athelia psychrophila]|uniref:Uncharacterized protein n=1 Tax=Athelia psychrophila TaxID=1759441 RepID=A0A167U0E5_9AGAM|nr:hypothetical protein FIBSPDRAFT_968965 [Fibularhizoctonia sp. CBS 109695]